MSEVRVDVCVIGGGIAGVAAALAARQEGKSVLVITKAPGATALYGGTLDVACGADRDGRLTSRAAARALAKDPCHPYALFGVETLAAALSLVATPTLGFRGPGLDAAPLFVATELGTVKAAPFAEASVAAGTLPAGGVVALARVRGYPRFDAAFAAKNLQQLAARSGRVFEVKVIDVDLPQRQTIDPAPAEAARALDDDAALASFGSAVGAAARAANADRVLFPAILGLRSPRAAALSEAAGVVCAELCAGTPSLHGARLYARLGAALTACGALRKTAMITSATSEKGRVLSLVISGSEKIAASSYVLASGKYVGGGVIRDTRLREPLFDLPVFWRDTDVSDFDPIRLTAAKPWEEQRLFSSGVAVDSSARPLGRNREPAFENLFAAGSVVAGYDADHEGSGFGVALVTGYAAGRSAAAAATTKTVSP